MDLPEPLNVFKAFVLIINAAINAAEDVDDQSYEDVENYPLGTDLEYYDVNARPK